MAVDLPHPIKIEDTSFKTEIIDLDDYASPEEAVLRWHIKVRNQFKTLYGDENEDTLNHLMKWYIETLVEDSFEIEVCQSFIKNMCKHIHFFHGYFKELNWISVDNYLDNMEDILALYLDFECDFYTKNSKMEQNVCKNLIKNLKIYLMHKEDRVFHVLLKIKLNLTSNKSQWFLDNLFKTVLSPVPINTSDVSFCRAYILHQRWKKVQSRPEMHKTIDELLYKHYHQTPNAINTNPILKEILLPQNDSLLDILAHIMENDKILCESYFKYIKKQRVQEDLIGEVSKIELDELVSSASYNVEEDHGTTDSETLNVFESIVKVNSQKNNDCVVEDVIKMEDSDEDDCIIVGEGTIDCDPSETEIVHEILDDDEDIEAIIYFTAKEPTPSKPPSTKKSTRPSEEISFLNSIDIQEMNSNKENTNSNIRSPSISISPPSLKSQNFDNDSVKSREILSRKFTRKKSDNSIVEIIEDTNNTLSCTALDVNEWDKTNSNNNEPEEPSRIFEGLVTPPTSHDDQHGYERDFHNEHIENSCYKQNTDNKEIETGRLTPHSTNFNNSDFCNNSNDVQEKIISESYTSPTSPDISSTCEPSDLIGEYEQETESEPSEENRHTTSTPLIEPVNENSTLNSSIAHSSKEKSVFSDIQIETAYSMEDLTENNPIENNHSLNETMKENCFTKDSTEGNYLITNGIEESVHLNCSSQDHCANEVTSLENLMEDSEESDIFRNDSPSVLDNTVTDNVQKEIINSPLEKENVDVQSKSPKKVVEEQSVAGDTLNLEIANPCIQEKTIINEPVNDNIFKRMNGEHPEHNNVVEAENVSTKQLTVSVPRLDIKTEKKMDVIFTSKQRIKKLENEVHLRYNELKGEHGLDDCFSGAIEKINCQQNIVTNFDLFDDSISIEEPDINLTSLNNSNSTTSPSSIASPEFDGGIDDFRNYLVNYQETAKKALKISPVSLSVDKASKMNSIERPVRRLKSDTNKNVLAPQLKRKRIAFADEDIVNTTSTHKPIINSPNQIQGILKKTTVQSPILKIPREQMNLQSLAQFRVKPTDYYLQSNPCVVIEKLSEMEIKEWQRVSEKTRRKRLLKQKPSQPFSSVPSMTMFRVDYDKQAPFLSSSVTVRYRAPEDQNWRSNTRDTKIDSQEEGIVESDLEESEYFYIPTMCKNKCCINLPEQFSKLNLKCNDFNNVNSTISKISRNPFCAKMFGSNVTSTENTKTGAKSFIDLKLVNKIIENFDKCDESTNSFDFLNQPAAIPEVEEFEKTLKMEEVTKVSNIPSDLDNLNLRKFTPSPVINCFSPHSPAYHYFSDSSNFNDGVNSFQINENIEGKQTQKHEQEINIEEASKNQRIWVRIAEEELKYKLSKNKEEETFQNQKTVGAKTEIEEEPQTRLPLKKRKHSLANTIEANSDEETIGPEVIEEILKRARAEENESDISYPATPAISIAEVQERLESQPRTFKTPAEKKEMPPPPVPDYMPVPKIITEQYNTHTYNNPTINYHMNNVPYPFFPCTYFSPILCTPAFDVNVVNAQQPGGPSQNPHPTENEVKIKKEKRSKKKRRE
ncbi:uncharacterized protein MAL13P1.304-like isoform X1 [Diorhabda sublineata]|uniref:uncharacterized protein MAL13P1.304-like isoform X1 n=1 Tax=Diorhabda sublineata TaxID=1163346 RepID=UPI0024E04F57|nr:uncharacterized protein MAL13P1.304-like isoform X1 [Diorhabda sublineata]XP_056637886.1 uncharacterized protein MAL13P1.304-like isoform X1 [Diorhabda sublineata]